MKETISATLLSPELLEKQGRNFDYLDSLKLDSLLFPFREEAGRAGSLQYFKGTGHGGWDNPLCQIRGTFTGHYLMAQSDRYFITQDARLRATLDYLIDELALCQEDNGGEWVFPIPEKYLYALKRGKHFWAPQYVCQKVMSGILAVYQATGNPKALAILDKAANWFVKYTKDCDREAMQNLFDFEETGAMLELWANLYAEKQQEKYLELMEKYTRYRHLEPLLAGQDIFTNMHANTQIPEINGFARAYEVTGFEDFRRAVETYWLAAFENRGLFASGAQGSGEVFTPPHRQESRLGEMTQEHCTVYNSIKLADYLYRWTGETKYLDFIEKNIHNGILAQTFWKSRNIGQIDFDSPQEEGVVSYYLPLAASSQKKWGNGLDHFWCCHCSAIEANTCFYKWLSYFENDKIYVGQYFSHEANFKIQAVPVKLRVTADQEFGDETIVLSERARTRHSRGSGFPVKIEFSAAKAVKTEIFVRIPAWSKNDFQIESALTYENVGSYVKFIIDGQKKAEFKVIFQKKLSTYPLADNPSKVAFLDGPVLLAGLIAEERAIYSPDAATENLLIPYAERVWGDFNNDYQITHQPVNFIFKPVKNIGKERYTVYFPIENKTLP